MNYNFDHIVERRGSSCCKWDSPCAKDLLPMWIADMDFEVAPFIKEALRRRVEHGVFGYECIPEKYYQTIIDWFLRRHDWRIDRNSMIVTIGVVPAISAILQALTQPGDQVVVLTPIYNCFFSSIRNSKCEAVEVPLRYDPRGYEIDWTALEEALSSDKARILLWCSPHNPACRVWSRPEIQRMIKLCQRHGVRIVSDEIHCEFVHGLNLHFPTATFNDDVITCVAPSKAFNIAGLQNAIIVCNDAATRERIDRAININETCDVNPFGVEAVIAAYKYGDEWIDQLNEYILENFDHVNEAISEALPAVHITPLQGTYLAWLDCRAYGLTSEQLVEHIAKHGGVLLNAGTMYGKAGEGFVRMNLATQRPRVEQGTQGIIKALSMLEPQN